MVGATTEAEKGHTNIFFQIWYVTNYYNFLLQITNNPRLPSPPDLTAHVHMGINLGFFYLKHTE